MVAEILRYKGYEPFLPTYNAKRRWSDRTKILPLPLFSGYLFCRFDVANRLGLGVHAALALVHSGELRAADVSLTPGGRPRWR